MGTNRQFFAIPFNTKCSWNIEQGRTFCRKCTVTTTLTISFIARLDIPLYLFSRNYTSFLYSKISLRAVSNENLSAVNIFLHFPLLLCSSLVSFDMKFDIGFCDDCDQKSGKGEESTENQTAAKKLRKFQSPQQRSMLRRRNSTGTIYIATTMSAQDNKTTIGQG